MSGAATGLVSGRARARPLIEAGYYKVTSEKRREVRAGTCPPPH